MDDNIYILLPAQLKKQKYEKRSNSEKSSEKSWATQSTDGEREKGAEAP